MFYLIFTEARDNLRTLASKHFEGFTMFDTLGCWQGKTEASSVVLVATDDRSQVDALARAILTENTQESVMVLPLVGQAEFVS